ncbi:MAG TPA: hypothetical protein VFD94_01535 [Jatrophihabitans sp.]|nr:hypothetical protein [Jatrophihabitans sp.]
MYSYVLEFNLAHQGEERAQEYTADAARTWPKLWGDIPGVTGTLLLSSAIALGGEFEYQWRVDIESLATLATIDATMRSGENGWRQARKDWFAHRSQSRAHISTHVDGNERYCLDGKGSEGGVHLVFHSRGEGRSALGAVQGASGVLSSQLLRPVVGASSGHEQTWLRLDSLESLDNVAALDVNAVHGNLFGELREVDGSIFAGA